MVLGTAGIDQSHSVVAKTLSFGKGCLPKMFKIDGRVGAVSSLGMQKSPACNKWPHVVLVCSYRLQTMKELMAWICLPL